MKQIRFVVDVNIGKLAHFLRMLGFDVVYDRHLESDEELARIAFAENRVLLTRDVELLKRKIVTSGYFVNSDQPKEQVLEVLKHFDLVDSIQFCTRCMDCNIPIIPITKEMVFDRIPPKARDFYNEFYLCPNCEKVFWKGTHYTRMQELLAQWKNQLHQQI